MRLVVGPVEATLVQGSLRKCRRRSGACDQHGIGLRSHDLQDLPGHAGVGPGKPLHVGDLDVLRRHRPLGFRQPAVSIGVIEADECHGLDAMSRHVCRNAIGHEAVVLRCLEDPVALGIHRLDQRGRGSGAISSAPSAPMPHRSLPTTRVSRRTRSKRRRPPRSAYGRSRRLASCRTHRPGCRR